MVGNILEKEYNNNNKNNNDINDDNKLNNNNYLEFNDITIPTNFNLIKDYLNNKMYIELSD